MTIMTTMPDYYDDDTVDRNDHKNDSYTAAGAAPGASVPCSGFRLLASGFWLPVRSGPVWLPVQSSFQSGPASGLASGFQLPASGFRPRPASL